MRIQEAVSKPFVEMRVRKSGLRECPRLNGRSFGRHFMTLENGDSISFETTSLISQRDLIIKPRVAVLRYPGLESAPNSRLPQGGLRQQWVQLPYGKTDVTPLE